MEFISSARAGAARFCRSTFRYCAISAQYVKSTMEFITSIVHVLRGTAAVHVLLGFPTVNTYWYDVCATRYMHVRTPNAPEPRSLVYTPAWTPY